MIVAFNSVTDIECLDTRHMHNILHNTLLYRCGFCVLVGAERRLQPRASSASKGSDRANASCTATPATDAPLAVGWAVH